MTLLYLEQLLVTLILLNDVDKNLDDDDGNSGDYIDETPLHPSYIEVEEALNEFHNLFLFSTCGDKIKKLSPWCEGPLIYRGLRFLKTYRRLHKEFLKVGRGNSYSGELSIKGVTVFH